VCLEMVLENDKQFGVLDGCDHTFCLKCIRGWRATYDRRTSKHHFRTCPICRKNSYLVIPSYYMVNSGPDKDALIEEYCDTLKNIPCKHFNGGQGSCPFRNSCNYAHEIGGQHYEYPWVD
jgi:E3 ubiquitin-protein ligase makorin